MTEEEKKSSDLIAQIEENFKEIVDQKNLESSAKLYNNVDSEMKNTLQIFDNFINELVWVFFSYLVLIYNLNSFQCCYSSERSRNFRVKLRYIYIIFLICSLNMLTVIEKL